MTITLELSPDEEARLREKAAARGQNVSNYLKSMAERDAADAEQDAFVAAQHRAMIEAPIFTPDPEAVARDVEAAGGEDTPLGRGIKEMLARTPEQVREARARLLATARPACPLPPGKTLEDVIVGKWPGDETDEEIARALEDLS